METLRTLTTDRTHLFPGARLRLDGPNDASELDVVVLFSDGAHAEGAMTPTDDGFSLRVDEYRTAAGTEIPAKAWELSCELDGALGVARQLDEN